MTLARMLREAAGRGLAAPMSSTLPLGRCGISKEERLHGIPQDSRLW